MKKNRLYLAIGLNLAIVLLTNCQVLGPSEGTHLEKINASPQFLKIPKGLTGDFSVAETAPSLEFAILPNQWEGARLWSSWGNAVWASDGNIYTSIGDHAVIHGTTYVYKISPETGQIKLVVDVNKYIDTDPNHYAPGKIHGPLVDGKDGWLYFATYPGSINATTDEKNYKGDWLFRYNVKSEIVENLGVLVPYGRIPMLKIDVQSKRLYGLATRGKNMPGTAESLFFVYSLSEGKLVFTCERSRIAVSRDFILTNDGTAYFNDGGELVKYDPVKNSISKTGIRLPGKSTFKIPIEASKQEPAKKKKKAQYKTITAGTIRAASRESKQGFVYCISMEGLVYKFDVKKQNVTEINKAFVNEKLYTAVCVIDPTGRFLYYVPSAHGRSYIHGTAVIQMDVDTGKRKVIAFLNDYFRQHKHYNLGGTYSIALNPKGDKLFIGWNGSNEQPYKEFGLCSAMIVNIPQSER